MSKLPLRVPALALLASIAGCATGPSDDGAARDGEPAGAAVEHDVDNRTVALLWDRAEQARQEARLGDAVTALERALDLAPEDPVLWSRLAELRLRQGDAAAAEGLAAKSNALAGDRPSLRYRNWLLIGEARRQRGDGEGAEAARAEAERLRGGS